MSISAPAPNGFLYAYIDTGLPGAREVTRPTTALMTTAEGYQHFGDWVKAMNTVVAAGDSSAITHSTSTGLCSFIPGATGNYQFDRSGILTGITDLTDTNIAMTDGQRVDSSRIPAGAIWLMGAEMDSIRYVRELKFDTFRWKRGYGYSWGGARLYRWRLTMHREALEAFELGWCATGKVQVTMGTGTMSFTGTGYKNGLTGYVVGVESTGWLGPAAEVAEVTMIIAASD